MRELSLDQPTSYSEWHILWFSKVPPGISLYCTSVSPRALFKIWQNCKIDQRKEVHVDDYDDDSDDDDDDDDDGDDCDTIFLLFYAKYSE